MKEHERFEMLVSSKPFNLSTAKKGYDYISMQVQELRAMWIAGRADAFQEAQEYYMTSLAKDETTKTVA